MVIVIVVIVMLVIIMDPVGIASREGSLEFHVLQHCGEEFVVAAELFD
jgi:hypothetical protein